MLGPAVRSAGCGEQRHGEGWVPRGREGGPGRCSGEELEKLEWGQKGGERKEASAGALSCARCRSGAEDVVGPVLKR